MSEENDATESSLSYGSNKKSHGQGLISVEAPSNLPEGFVFDVVHNGHVVSVVVPPGGVKAGQIFTVTDETTTAKTNNNNSVFVVPEADVVVATEVTPITSLDDHGRNYGRTTEQWTTTAGPSTTEDETMYETDPAPLGIWKDGLCDCCSLGCCHPSLCCAMWCPQLLLGQVLTRMHMTWCGVRTRSPSEYKSTFPTLALLTMIYFFIRFWFPSHHDRQHPLMRLVNIVYFVYMLIVVSKLRTAVRQRYKIPERQPCVGCEDFCCALFCSCCTISQLARQTAMYSQRRAVPCSSTGLPENSTRTFVIEESSTIVTTSTVPPPTSMIV